MAFVPADVLAARRATRALRIGSPRQTGVPSVDLGGEGGVAFKRRLHLQTSVVQVLALLHRAYQDSPESDTLEILDQFCTQMAGHPFLTTMVGLEMLAGDALRQ